jgi:hypothetical protein
MGTTPKTHPKVSVRIIGAKLSLAKESRPEIRWMREKNIKEDELFLGPATLTAAEHRQKAIELKRTAESAEDELVLDMIREAAAHALWAGDEELAVACYRDYIRRRVRIEQV